MLFSYMLGIFGLHCIDYRFTATLLFWVVCYRFNLYKTNLVCYRLRLIQAHYVIDPFCYRPAGFRLSLFQTYPFTDSVFYRPSLFQTQSVTESLCYPACYRASLLHTQSITEPVCYRLSLVHTPSVRKLVSNILGTRTENHFVRDPDFTVGLW